MSYGPPTNGEVSCLSDSELRLEASGSGPADRGEVVQGDPAASSRPPIAIPGAERLGGDTEPYQTASSRPPIAVLGVLLDNVTTAQALQRIETMVASGRPHYVVTANADFLVQAASDIELRRILLDAHLALCDGTPVLWASRFLGNPLPERVAGSDLVPLLIARAARKKYRVYFLGSAPERAEAAVRNLRQQHPTLEIAGHYSPPYSSLLDMDHEDIGRRIKEAKPDILFVCFGCPKQEKWIAMHFRNLGVPVCIGVGGTMDFLAGSLKRAPQWMRQTGTEWVFRMAQEPRRLVGRYAKDLWGFGTGVLRQWWRMGNRLTSLQIARVDREPVVTGLPGGKSGSEFQLIRLPSRVDWTLVDANPRTIDEVTGRGAHCLVQMANVTFMDSTGVGFLIRLQKAMNEAGRFVVLVSASRAARRALITMRLLEFFPAAESIAAAEALIAARIQERQIDSLASFARGTVTWRGEITAANAPEVWARTERSLADTEGPWTIDLAGVRFIDSTGLGLMIRTSKLARRQQKNLFFINPQPAVRNVVRLANLEKVLILSDTPRGSITSESWTGDRVPSAS